MKVIAAAGNGEIAKVYIVDLGNGQLVECVESLQSPLARHEKWVLLVSTMFGCPVGCKMCDAGGFYHGKPSAAQILDQIDFLVRQRFPDGHVPSRQFKIEEYIEGVVAAEIGREWETEALKAQAVISRTYAAYYKRSNSGNSYHITSSTLHQLYKGKNEDLSITDAVNATSRRNIDISQPAH